jgi:NTE family protein
MSPPQTLAPLEAHADPLRAHGAADLGLVMGGGGARAAYQVGFLRSLALRFPDLQVPYITGVSAGAINAALLASHHGTFLQATEELTQLWARLTVEDVFRVDGHSLLWNSLQWGRQLISGGFGGPPRVKGLVDTRPLRAYLTEVLHAVGGELTGIGANLEAGRLKAVAISTSSYSTGQSITWIQGQDIKEWERPQRRARQTVLTVDHVMASASLPLFFPAVRLDNAWYGDGGVRLTAPLSPSLHLGARRIIAISTRYARSAVEADQPAIYGYPPPAQVVGVLMNSIFLDLLDHDALRLEQLNRLIEQLPDAQREGLRPVKLLVLRPSVDLGKLATAHEADLPKAFRFLTRGLGTRQTRSPDFLSLVLFQPAYLRTLIEIGEADGAERADEVAAFLDGTPRDARASPAV